jgi:hypothetical protein
LNWIYEGQKVTEVPEGAEGFIYIIHFSDGTKYLGKKSFWSRRKTAVKGSLKKKLTVKESDWRTYKGSSELSKQKAKEGLVESLEIICFADSRGALMYLEVKEMLKRDVLCSETYLNANILMKLFRCYSEMPIDLKGK